MIQDILKGKKYIFKGTVNDLKKCIGGFNVTEIVLSGKVNDYEMFDAYATFKYHGMIHKIYLSKAWTENKISIEYRGIVH